MLRLGFGVLSGAGDALNLLTDQRYDDLTGR
jgi:hypothetical protein